MAAMPFRAKKRLKKCCAGKYFMTWEDRISELPDDIIVQVLSSLTMREAGRTSVLSKRWKHVWSYIPTLNFDSRDVIDHVELRIKDFDVQWPKYLYWVNQVLSLYKAPIIDEFTVRFDFAVLNERCENSIGNWLRFAMEKRVKRFVIDFSRIYRPNGSTFVTLPSSNLSSSCNSLTSLDLVRVNITGEVLESLLWKCLALEQLSVKHSESLEKLTVAGPLLKLKTLSIVSCFKVKKLEISAPNLVYVCYFGPKINVYFKSTPKLAQVSIGDRYADDLIHSFSDLSSYLSQIEVLTLSPCVKIEKIRLSNTNPVFSRLSKLDFAVTLHSDDDLLFFGPLIIACPFLHHLKLQLDVIGVKPVLDLGLRRPETGLHYHLKIVEIVGFVGKLVDIEIVGFLIDIAVSLDRIILHTRETDHLRTPFELEKRPRESRARMMAEAIHVRLEPNTKLEIF